MAFLQLLLALTSLTTTSRPSLHLNRTNKFKIAAFSDLHFGEDEHSFGPAQDIGSTQLMHHVFDSEDPDFSVLNGDLITGENTFAPNSTKYVDVIVKPIVDRGYRWASTYGNHDSKYNLSREGILREEQKYASSYTQQGPPGTDGVTNYMLPIYAAPRLRTQSTGTTPIALLYFLDSRGGSSSDPTNLDNIPNHVSTSTATWLSSLTATNHRRWGLLPSLLFVHIPPSAFATLQSSSNPTVSSKQYPGLNADKPLAHQARSAATNDTYTGEDVPFMDALLEVKGLHSVYVGHDHGDSWCGLWPSSGPPLNAGASYASNNRPFLCFCKHSGFGGYGTWNRGVRMIEMEFDEQGRLRGVETWIRMQNDGDGRDGGVVARVGLNGTYGVDVYDEDDGGYRGD